MNVHFTYKLSKTPDVENLIDHQIEKLRKRLQVFKPDMISLHGTLEEGPRIGYTASLNLRLPAAQMAARNSAETLPAALRGAFDDIVEQLTKHKDQLRSQHQYPRQRRVSRVREVSQVPFEETIAAVHPDQISGQDISTFVNANVDRMRRIIDRELWFRRNSGQDNLRDVSADEVLSEAVANAMSDGFERPDKMAIEPWLYRMSRNAMDRISSAIGNDNGDGRDVSLDGNAHKLPENAGDDDALRQFDFDGDTVNNSNNVADSSFTPEEIFANDEIIDMVHAGLAGASREDREAFILFTFEGLTLHELSAVTDRSVDDIRASIRSARERLQKAMPVRDRFKDRIFERSKIA